MILTRRRRILVLLPLALSALTHLWNPSGFPDIFYDEGVYMRRAMHLIEGFGPQEGIFYDHPYFGQFFLAVILGALHFPDYLEVTSDVNSISTLYMVPRVLMGFLAVADTFLIYRIAEHRYNRRVALISAILFAVMPSTWLVRRVLLDSILLPFLLSSILFALYSNATSRNTHRRIAILLAGVFLGISIYTKLPALIMLPLAGYLLFEGSKRSTGRRLTTTLLWIAPIIFFSLLWPIQSALDGQFEAWLASITYQSQRQGAFLLILAELVIIDPVLVLLSTAGFVYALLTRDWFIILWIIPFSIFLSSGVYVQYFHWIPVLPAYCLASGKLLNFLYESFATAVHRRVLLIAVTGVWLFGLVSTFALITTDVTSSQFEALSFVLRYTEDKTTTVVSSPVYSWILKYPFERENVFNDYRDILFLDPRTDAMILVADYHFMSNTRSEKELQSLYENSRLETIYFGQVLAYDHREYPYWSMYANQGGSIIEVRTANRTDYLAYAEQRSDHDPTAVVFEGPSLDAQIAVSSSNVYVVWSQDPSERLFDVFFLRSTDNGVTWESVENLSHNGHSDDPDLATSGPDVFVVWQDRDIRKHTDEIFLRRSVDDGATWESVKNLTNNPRYPSATPQVGL